MDGEPFPGAEQREVAGVIAGGAQVGKVTSAIYSPRLQKNIGYCWLPTQLSQRRNDRSRSRPSGAARNATVVEMPFVDPNKQIPIS